MQTTELPYLQRINPVFIIFTSLFLLIIPFLTWSYYAKIDQKTSAHGIAIATAKTQKIQSAIDGVIDDILVQEGQIVKKGDTLIKLEKSQNKAALDAINSKIAALKVKLYRLKAEVYNKNLNYPKNYVSTTYKDFITTQKKLFSLRRKAINDETSSIQEALNLKNKELKLTQVLVNSGDIGKMKLLTIKRQINDLKGKIVNIKNKFFQATQEEMTKTEEELSVNLELLTQKDVIYKRSQIYSKMDAIVKNIIITTRGAKVRPGDIILELLPLDDNLIIEAKLKPIDISFIKVGQVATIKLDAYDYSIYGMFYGKVKYISPDTIIKKTQRGDEPYYRVLISLDTNKLKAKNNKIISVTPGMGAQIDIQTGQRTVLNYITKPIVKVMDESFTQR